MKLLIIFIAMIVCQLADGQEKSNGNHKSRNTIYLYNGNYPCLDNGNLMSLLYSYLPTPNQYFTTNEAKLKPRPYPYNSTTFIIPKNEGTPGQGLINLPSIKISNALFAKSLKTKALPFELFGSLEGLTVENSKSAVDLKLKSLDIKNDLVFDYDTLQNIYFEDCNANIIVANTSLLGSNIGLRGVAGSFFASMVESKKKIEYSFSEFKGSIHMTSSGHVLFSDFNSNFSAIYLELLGKDNNIRFEASTFNQSPYIKYQPSIDPDPEKKNYLNSLILSSCNFKQSMWFPDADTIKIASCNFQGNSVQIGTNSRNDRRTKLFLKEVDLNKLYFEMTDYRDLIFKSEADSLSNIEIDELFTGLLEKFKKEGKLNSLKNTDIQYKKYKYERACFLGEIWNIVDWAWWNYGYDGQRIIWYSLGFLFLFFIINYAIAASLFEFYHIKNGKNVFHVIRGQHSRNRVIVVLTLTLFILFSYKLDLDKMNLKKTSLLAYFLVQYSIGLICLFFLLNAVLKL